MDRKKVYIAPQMEVVDIEVAQMLATSDRIPVEDEWGESAVNNKRRGQWGNLWYEEK